MPATSSRRLDALAPRLSHPEDASPTSVPMPAASSAAKATAAAAYVARTVAYYERAVAAAELIIETAEAKLISGELEAAIPAALAQMELSASNCAAAQAAFETAKTAVSVADKALAAAHSECWKADCGVKEAQNGRRVTENTLAAAKQDKAQAEGRIAETKIRGVKRAAKRELDEVKRLKSEV